MYEDVYEFDEAKKIPSNTSSNRRKAYYRSSSSNNSSDLSMTSTTNNPESASSASSTNTVPLVHTADTTPVTPPNGSALTSLPQLILKPTTAQISDCASSSSTVLNAQVSCTN